MAKSPKKRNSVSRRSVLPLLGGSLLLPLMGHSRLPEKEMDTDADAYETLLKPDGTTVRVRKSSINNAKVVKTKISNRSLLHWLGKKK